MRCDLRPWEREAQRSVSKPSQETVERRKRGGKEELTMRKRVFDQRGVLDRGQIIKLEKLHAERPFHLWKGKSNVEGGVSLHLQVKHKAQLLQTKLHKRMSWLSWGRAELCINCIAVWMKRNLAPLSPYLVKERNTFFFGRNSFSTGLVKENKIIFFPS